MSENSNVNTQSIADYLAQLLKDRKQVTAFPNVFVHVERLIDEGRTLMCFEKVVIFLIIDTVCQ